jgi:uroporphyrinogen-III synthase
VLVHDLFRHVEEIRSLDVGYALQFRRSRDQGELEELIGTIADYVIFESRNTPQLTFHIVEEAQGQTFWLQVRNIVGTSPNSTAYTRLDRPRPSLF